MILELKEKANLGWRFMAAGYICALLTGVWSGFIHESNNPLFGLISGSCLLIGSIAFWYAVYWYGRAKGYGWWVLLLPLLSVFGLIVLFVLKDKCPHGYTEVTSN
jgi:hypothetical protein